ncbi:ribosomal L7Ae/L30e/S12e/Gadd45 family protein [Clostridium sp. SYSU_GA19001]|uniref:ribosomal L7Ae/L30e/S12e/Gadd45 family protein n=1 Tax=Clostridium caldaquaticum TaxID=2940653 RepID=UPI002076DB93|nr:ribosomal L7Ae/L30e/S12e/Gadd45 family protein [Clostridium caldaquaticum]MCM8712071.1 ribosomal L7Ae/L30e/S12e/Gadd45 family protein [Clostridium caldaquaticum]
MVERLVGKKVVGLKQSIKAIKNGEAKTLYAAIDADTKLIEPVVKLAKENSLEIQYVNTMKDLGRLCGIDVGAATAVLLKD